MNYPRAGDIITAPPGMLDSRFRESVIFLAQATDHGSWGICLNKHIGYTTQDLFRTADLDCELDVDLYWGGPVSQVVIWILHDPEWRMSNTVNITEHWSMTSHRSMFHELSHYSQPKHWRIFSGFSAWKEGQLQGEISGKPPWTSQSSWLCCQGLDPSWAFSQSDRELWTNSISLSSQQAVHSWMT